MEEFSIPASLLRIPDPPQRLFIRGNFPITEKYLCVVGSRKNSEYGKEACENLIKNLAGRSITIVSGLALGIDCISHQAALKYSLPTIAFPGSGLGDRALYPPTNINIAHNIISSGGCLLSEYDDTVIGTPWAFPARNRLMSGLSDAVLVIEAKKRSGTLITARMALDYNKTLCVVPGPINSLNFEGSNALIRLGASPILNSDDILEALNMTPSLFDPRPKKDLGVIMEKLRETCSENELILISNLFEPKSREELSEIIDMPIYEINVALTLLELKELITESAGKIHFKLL